MNNLINRDDCSPCVWVLRRLYSRPEHPGDCVWEGWINGVRWNCFPLLSQGWVFVVSSSDHWDHFMASVMLGWRPCWHCRLRACDSVCVRGLMRQARNQEDASSPSPFLPSTHTLVSRAFDFVMGFWVNQQNNVCRLWFPLYQRRWRHFNDRGWLTSSVLTLIAPPSASCLFVLLAHSDSIFKATNHYKFGNLWA